MATAFFFGEIGAGLFLVSLAFDSLTGMTLGVLCTAVGKTTGHMLHLGQPLRAWRAIFRIDRSWVSRGLLAIILFTGFGAGYILCRADLTYGLFPKSLAPLYAARTEVGTRFDEIREKEGLGAALRWRAAQFTEAEGGAPPTSREGASR